MRFVNPYKVETNSNPLSQVMKVPLKRGMREKQTSGVQAMPCM